MGQKLVDDKIGQLSESGGTITLAPSILSIGGQQYATDELNRIITDDIPSPVIAQRYQIFVVIADGTPAIRISANENSVGPAGFAGWKLVGSYYSDLNGEVGGFVSIEGIPVMEPTCEVGTLNISANSTPPVKGTINDDRNLLGRRGNKMRIKQHYNQINDAGANAGLGNYFLAIPGSALYSIDEQLQPFDPSAFIGANGTWNNQFTQYAGFGGDLNSGSSNNHWVTIPFDSTRMRFWGWNMYDVGASSKGGWGSNFFYLTLNSGALQFNFEYEVLIVGWTDTPIKDL
jgi:hypothetical protein